MVISLRRLRTSWKLLENQSQYSKSSYFWVARRRTLVVWIFIKPGLLGVVKTKGINMFPWDSKHNSCDPKCQCDTNRQLSTVSLHSASYRDRLMTRGHTDRWFGERWFAQFIFKKSAWSASSNHKSPPRLANQPTNQPVMRHPHPSRSHDNERRHG